MFFNLLTGVQDNYQSEPEKPIFTVVQKNDITVRWIIAIIIIAIIVTLITTGIIIYLCNKTNNKQRALKISIIVIDFILILLFITCGYGACASLA